MKIKDRPEFRGKLKPVTFSKETIISTAVREMSKRNIGSVVVVDQNDKIEGMVTERDLMKRVLNEGKDPGSTTLEDVMTRDVRVAKADDNIIDWLRIMSNERFRRVPVVDDDGRVIAVMTQGDFVSYTWPDLLNQARLFVKSGITKNQQIIFVFGGVFLYVMLVILIVFGWLRS